MAISLGAAALGLYLAYILYYKRPELPRAIADALGGFYDAVVQQVLHRRTLCALFVKPLLDGSTRILWHGVDQGVIDAAINNARRRRQPRLRRRPPHAIRQPALVRGLDRSRWRPSSSPT